MARKDLLLISLLTASALLFVFLPRLISPPPQTPVQKAAEAEDIASPAKQTRETPLLKIMANKRIFIPSPPCQKSWSPFAKATKS